MGIASLENFLMKFLLSSLLSQFWYEIFKMNACVVMSI